VPTLSDPDVAVDVISAAMKVFEKAEAPTVTIQIERRPPPILARPAGVQFRSTA
jgi:hypothetical protein